MAILTMNEVLANEVQTYLAGSEATLINTIMNLSPRVGKGKGTVTIPRISGLALKDVAAGGNRQTAGGMTSAGDVLVMDQVKEVPEYISYSDDMDSALELKSAFVNAAPRVYVEGLEKLVAAQIAAVKAANKLTAKIDGSDIVAKLGAAKKILDKKKAPKTERFAALDADGMELLAKTPEFQDGSKALSAEALKQGVVSQVKGFFVVQSEDVPRGGTDEVQVMCYHKSHVAFAVQDQMKYIDKEIEEYGQFFVSLRGKYGSKVLDSGERGVLITLNVA